ncbi:SDR family NAD(P)-dependent oxidoreductase [Euzebya rosea]|uniref:SDR family NAD(P)-dependent oxidoreductase n=1 Tax=Euzebya rosea TaxID=2052804 RepID=UPI000D3E39C6|nr:SDR family NAD(P)-dependent oxidoreductase [Euzebya rosea]
MKDFSTRVAAITGAGSGIGRALAVELAAAGCNLALSDIDPDGLDATAGLVADRGVTVTTDVVDVADRNAMQRWADDTAEAHGAVHLVFNNAGVALAGTVEDTSIEDYEWILGINFWGVIHGTKMFMPHLRAADRGHIVNISSVFGLFAQPTQSGYNATKFAVRGFTEALRQELDMDDGNVSCTCVHPGGIDTNIARNARVNKSLAELVSGDEDEIRQGFQKVLHVSPDAAARTILKGVRRNARRVLIGPEAYAVDAMQRALPTAYQRLVPLSTKLL